MPNSDLNKVFEVIKSGGVGIIPTDTLYGIVGSALNKKAVERIYKIRKRSSAKPMIVLIPSVSTLEKFGIKLDLNLKKILKSVWPGKVSVVVDCKDRRWEYLHRGKKSLAFRLPDDKWLIDFLRRTGPLVAPSANFEGEKPATTIAEAKKYFKENVDFYVDYGKLSSKPSKIIKFTESGEVEVIRK